MRAFRNLLAGLVLLGAASTAPAADLTCRASSNIESFHYSWRVRGAIGWLAGLVFPTSGVGELKTTFPKDGERNITSELLVTPTDGRSGFYVYQSQMDEGGARTTMTYHGYAWGKKSRKEQTLFDYTKRVALIHKETPQKKWEKTKPIPSHQFRDMLTAIYYLRQYASTIKAPVTTSIYSDGEEYPVILQPAERRSFNFAGKTVNAIGFEIVDAPGGKKWDGGIKVWLSDDARRVPVRIEINESVASLQLDLSYVESCAQFAPVS